MKLITELTESVHTLVEMEESGKKSLFIEGVFLQADIQNKNNRVYPSHVMDKEVARYIKEAINVNRAVGELGHPDGPGINYERVSHKIVGLRKEGTNYIGKAKILSETPMGKIVQNLLSEDVQIGVSSRGMGTVKPNKSGIMEVQDDFHLATAADIVADPSAPNAFVRGIMENVDWVYDAASGSWRAMELAEKVKKAGKVLTEEQKLRVFNRFLSNLAKK